MDNQDAERNALLQMMQEAESGVDVDAKYGAKPAEAAAEEPGKAPEQPKEAPEQKKEGAPPPKDDPAKSSLNKEQPKAPESEAKPKSKWAANEERKQKTWEQINAEKEAIKAEKEALERERKEWQAKQVQSPADRLKDEHGYTAEDYAKFAKERIDSDNAEERKLAKAALDRAAQLEKQEGEARQKASHEKLSSEWAKTYTELSTKNAALKDPNSEEYKAVVDIINRYPLLAQDANGLRYAVKAVELERAAKDSEVKDSKIKQLTEQLESLQKKLAIGSGVPSEPPKGEKSFDDMSLDEQRAYLEKAAKQADRAAGFLV